LSAGSGQPLWGKQISIRLSIERHHLPAVPNSHRVICTIAAVLLAIAATMIGWSQSLIYKDVPQIPLEHFLFN
jgi:hypothetical protein